MERSRAESGGLLCGGFAADEGRDAVSGSDQALGDGRADVSSRSGEEDVHFGLLISLCLDSLILDYLKGNA